MNRKKLRTKIRSSETYSFLRLCGVIDEDNHLASLVSQLTGDILIVDAGEVDRINSCGVRDWVNWLQAVEEQGFKIVLIRSSPSLVTQINLVTNFIGKSIVHSFFAPYYCPSCDREYSKLIETETLVVNRPARAPSFRCGDCGGVLDFDDIEESYFAFVNAYEAGHIDYRFKGLVEEVAPGLEAKIRALNEAGSASLSGPLHTIGGTPEGPTTPDRSISPSLPANYFEIDEETERAEGGAEPPVDLEEEVELAPEPTSSSNSLMIVFIVSAAIVIALLVYFAVTGI